MTDGSAPRFILVHADESCLGNQNAGPQPGGAGALVEVGGDGAVQRWDWFHASPATTNNRMALSGAISILERIARSSTSSVVHYYSDSKYLVDGITEWIHGWKKRGWARKGGAIENVELWKRLDRARHAQDVTFHWVRGHDGHAKNEYADYLAVRAARTQQSSDGFVPSDLEQWLADEGAQFAGAHIDEHFMEREEALNQ